MTKPTKWHVRPAKTQVSLGICPVWSESSLSAWRKLGSLAIHWVHSENSDQTRSLRWVHMPFCWFCHEAAHYSSPWPGSYKLQLDDAVALLFILHQKKHQCWPRFWTRTVKRQYVCLSGALFAGEGHIYLLLKYSWRPSIWYQTWLYLEADPLRPLLEGSITVMMTWSRLKVSRLF